MSLRPKAAQRHNVTPVGALPGKHREPTWGDTNKLTLILSALQISNSANLHAGLCSPIIASKHLQTIRNACAHLNDDRLRDVKGLRVFYSKSPFIHPSDAILWVDAATGDYAWEAWAEELRIAGKLAVS